MIERNGLLLGVMDFIVAESYMRSFGHAGRCHRGNVFGLYQYFDVITFN